MDNIPEGYDENGIRSGFGDWEKDLEEFADVCPECNSTNVYRNENDFLVCDNCGYEEVPLEKMGVCSECGADTPKDLLINGLCPICAEDVEL